MNPNNLMAGLSTPGAAETFAFVAKFNQIILYPVIALLTGLAFLFFVYGCFIYILNAENSSAREEGQWHIIYSLVGMFVMLAAYGILTIAVNTFGLGGKLDCAKNPNATGCYSPSYVPSDCTKNGSPC